MKTRAFVKYTKSGRIIPGSLILTKGDYPKGSALWYEVPTDLCCLDNGVITFCQQLTSITITPETQVSCPGREIAYYINNVPAGCTVTWTQYPPSATIIDETDQYIILSYPNGAITGAVKANINSTLTGLEFNKSLTVSLPACTVP